MECMEGFIPYDAEDSEKYNKYRCWSGLTFGDILDRAADIHPDKEAFIDSVSRVTYGQAVVLRERDYVEAAHVMGAGTVTVLARHILPHLLPVARFNTLDSR